MDKLSLVTELSKRLMWGDMLVHIALPAIDAILNMAEELSIDEKHLLNLSSNDIFGLLAGDAVYPHKVSPEDYRMFVSLRHEIEWEMLKGTYYIDAINEWWK